MKLALDVPTAALICLNTVLLAVYLAKKFKSRDSEILTAGFCFPIIGHALPVLYAHTRFLAWCRARYGGVYKLRLPQEDVIVISDPVAILHLQTRSPKELGPFKYQRTGPISGISEARVPHLFHILHRHVYPVAANALTPTRLAGSTARTAFNLDWALRRLSHNTDAMVQVDMLDLVTRIVFRASFTTFWGDRVPELLPDFLIYDKNMFFVVGDVPLLGRTGRRARERLVSTMHSYLIQHRSVPTDDVADEGGTIIAKAIRILEESGVTDDEIARCLVIILWGINGNIIQVAIWLMIYLTSTPSAFIRVRDAVRSAHPGIEPDPESLSEHFDDIPILDSAIKEVLRLVALPGTDRVTLVDITLPLQDGRTQAVRKGEHLLLDVRGVHHDPLYHRDPTAFKVDRFLDPEAKYGNHAGVKTLIPWGGGMFMCKGRDYAQRIIKLYFIILLQLYDIELQGSTTIPSPVRQSVTAAHPESYPPIKIRRRTSL
ncbi:unnamed protein product [Peniophora sp. CBMAI 1063]|nr:unnamed protein product [Peniophora sp. CBMAI 1063]